MAHVATVRTKKPACPPLPPCSTCGGLQCLCRPRFFAGQLLTEDDLTRLEDYIIAKNRLHNRYLHGWGIVCGLQIVPHPCPGWVRVKAGYALSPCGDDIIVGCDQDVPLCELINACRRQERDNCEYPCAPQPPPDLGGVELWELLICYDEKPSRGITALRGSSAATRCSPCACGGAASCGCGCGTAKTGGGDQTHGSSCSCASCGQRKPRNPTPQCEPTLTCEGFQFMVRRAPAIRFPAPFIPLDKIPLDPNKLPFKLTTMDHVVRWRRDLTASLKQLVVDHLDENPMLLTDLAKLAVEALPQTVNQAVTHIQKQTVIALKPIIDVIVQKSLAPSCPTPGPNACVVLGRVPVTFPGSGLGAPSEKGRKYVATFHNLVEWSGASLGSGVADLLSFLDAQTGQ